MSIFKVPVQQLTFSVFKMYKLDLSIFLIFCYKSYFTKNISFIILYFPTMVPFSIKSSGIIFPRVRSRVAAHGPIYSGVGDPISTNRVGGLLQCFSMVRQGAKVLSSNGHRAVIVTVTVRPPLATNS